MVSTLPVAGFSGSLDYRFVEVAPGGLGRVRAKTGTLTGVHGLAGVATTRLGHVLIFAAVADEVPVPRTLAARAQLDRIAAALASLPLLIGRRPRTVVVMAAQSNPLPTMRHSRRLRRHGRLGPRGHRPPSD